MSWMTQNDAGFYVDKLTQFYVMGCHFGSNAHDDTLLLNYLDDTLGRYRVRIVKRGKKLELLTGPTQPLKSSQNPMRRRRAASTDGSTIGWPRILAISRSWSKPRWAACR